MADVTPTPQSSPTTVAETNLAAAKGIKTATPDIILFDDSAVPIEVMTDLVFEDIGGQELLNISRTDTINGQIIAYQPIKNLSSINSAYDPNNILGIQSTSNTYFSGFTIKLENKVPKVSNSPDKNPVYMDASGNIVIDLVNLESDEQVEIQIAVSGTIYETEI